MAIKNVEDLREFLSNEMSKLTNGEATPSSVNAMANLAGKMLQSVKLEIEYNKIIGVNPSIDFLKRLGTSKKQVKHDDKL